MSDAIRKWSNECFGIQNSLIWKPFLRNCVGAPILRFQSVDQIVVSRLCSSSPVGWRELHINLALCCLVPLRRRCLRKATQSPARAQRYQCPVRHAVIRTWILELLNPGNLVRSVPRSLGLFYLLRFYCPHCQLL